MRIALGARRSRLVRQLLTESLVLATGGSLLGVALAFSVVQALRGIIPPTVLERSRGDFAIDGSVLMFSLAITVLATVVFGVGPAMRLSGAEPNPSLGGATRRLTGTQRDRRLRAALVVLETALSLVLLVGAGLLINSFWRLQRVDPGFRADRLLTFRIALPESAYRDKLVPVGDTFVWEGRQVPQFFDELLQRLAALPGVTGVAASGYAPLTGENNSASFEKERAGWMDSGGRPRTAFFRPVSANYFRTLGIPLLRGRELNERDIQGATSVALINETMARQYWPGEDPLDQRFRTSAQMPWRTVVGVVGDVRYRGLSEPPIPEMYFAYGQALWPQHTMTVLVRTAMSPTDVIATARREVTSLDPNLPIYDVRTMDQWIANSLAAPRFNVVLLGTVCRPCTDSCVGRDLWRRLLLRDPAYAGARAADGGRSAAARCRGNGPSRIAGGGCGGDRGGPCGRTARDARVVWTVVRDRSDGSRHVDRGHKLALRGGVPGQLRPSQTRDPSRPDDCVARRVAARSLDCPGRSCQIRPPSSRESSGQKVSSGPRRRMS